MFSLVGYYESQDSSAALVLAAALADPHLRVSGDDITLPEWAPNLLAATAFGAGITLAQLRSPGLREFAQMDLAPLALAAEPITLQRIQDWFDAPIHVGARQILQAAVAESTSGAEVDPVLVWIGDKIDPAPAGPMRTVRCTNGSTLGAGAWTNGALTFTQSLPAGKYAVVGMMAWSAGLLAARLVPPGAYHRPGCLGGDLLGDIAPDRFRYGRAGKWCQFDTDAPPTVDFLSVSADTAQEVYLDVVQLIERR